MPADGGLAQSCCQTVNAGQRLISRPASTAEVPDDLRDALEASTRAAEFFATLTGANRYAILYRLASVKRAETRARKIAEYVAMLERGETIHG